MRCPLNQFVASPPRCGHAEARMQYKAVLDACNGVFSIGTCDQGNRVCNGHYAAGLSWNVGPTNCAWARQHGQFARAFRQRNCQLARYLQHIRAVCAARTKRLSRYLVPAPDPRWRGRGGHVRCHGQCARFRGCCWKRPLCDTAQALISLTRVAPSAPAIVQPDLRPNRQCARQTMSPGFDGSRRRRGF